MLPLLSDHMLCSVTWVTDERVAVQWVTRKQNYVVVQIYDFDGSSWQEKQVAVTSLLLWIMTSTLTSQSYEEMLTKCNNLCSL